jgi:hypothetical protein
MRTMGILHGCLGRPAGIIVTGVGVLAAILTICRHFEINALVMILALLTSLFFLAFVWTYKDVSRLESHIDEIKKESRIEFLTTETEAGKVLTEMLENTKESLHYFGGAGLIGAYKSWQEVLKKKLGDKEFEMVRIIDLKLIQELKEIFKPEGKKDEADDIKKYQEWLETHSEHLESTAKENEFLNFAGAPLWKYGINYLIFDKKHLAITFIHHNVRKAIIIRNRSDIAKEIEGSIRYLRKRFKLRSLDSETLEGIAKEEISREELSKRSHET